MKHINRIHYKKYFHFPFACATKTFLHLPSGYDTVLIPMSPLLQAICISFTVHDHIYLPKDTSLPFIWAVSTVVYTTHNPRKLTSDVEEWSLMCQVHNDIGKGCQRPLWQHPLCGHSHFPWNSGLPHFSCVSIVVHIAHHPGKLTSDVEE